MENQDAGAIYGAGARAPYLTGVLLPQGARATAFADEAVGLPSEPHYVWMEAGTNAFADHTFTSDDPPSAGNSTGSAAHVVAQLAASARGADWMSYQEGLDAATGACPIHDAGFYTTSHNPFVFFRDVAGAPPSADAPACAAHHRPLSALSGDLASGAVAAYSFINPDVCHDMHGGSGCPAGDLVRAGDDWLSSAMPPLIAYAQAHQGAIFIVWDEGVASSLVPFVAVGPHVKSGYAGGVAYSHSSLVKSLDEILGLPVLPAVAGANDLRDLFADGFFP
jgi:hypothetical protein